MAVNIIHISATHKDFFLCELSLEIKNKIRWRTNAAKADYMTVPGTHSIFFYPNRSIFMPKDTGVEADFQSELLGLHLKDVSYFRICIDGL